VTQANASEGPKAKFDLLAPITVLAIEGSVVEDVLRDGTQQILFAAHVIVERHWRNTENIGQATHRDCVHAFAINEPEPGFDNVLASKIPVVSLLGARSARCVLSLSWGRGHNF